MMLSVPICCRKYCPGWAIRDSRPTQSQRCRKILSLSSAKISGEVKYRPGRVCAPRSATSVRLTKVDTDAALQAWGSGNMPGGRAGGKHLLQGDFSLHDDGGPPALDLERDPCGERSLTGERSSADPGVHLLLYFALCGHAEALEQLAERMVERFFIHQGASPSLIRSTRRPCWRGL